MHFNKYFKDFQDTWKGLTDIITLKTFSSNVLTAPSISDITTINSYITTNSDIANALTITSLILLNKQSTLINIILIILKTNVQIHFLSILLNDETANIIPSLGKNKSVGPCSVPYIQNFDSTKTKPLNHFPSGVFLSIQKMAKVVPVFKKDPKLYRFPKLSSHLLII